MGTNFYLFTKKREWKNKMGDNVHIVDEPSFGYEIHLAKTSAGWKPHFQAHKGFIWSVQDIADMYGTGDFRIYDEYGRKYTWNKFVDRVVNFNKDNPDAFKSLQDYNNKIHNEALTYIGFNNDFFDEDGYRFSLEEFS